MWGGGGEGQVPPPLADAHACCYSQKWDVVEIEEETEVGKKLRSTICVPMQASSEIHSLLFRVSAQVNRVGAHAFPKSARLLTSARLSPKVPAFYPCFRCRSVIGRLGEHLSALLLRNHRSWFEKVTSGSNSLAQNVALQHWFDVRFLSLVFPRKSSQVRTLVIPTFLVLNAT